MHKGLAVENNFKKRILGEKAITLIALVISIIVILILAGVTIVTLTGENGILTRTQTAVESNNASQEEELIRLAVQSAKVAGQGTITTDNLNKELRESFGDGSIVVNEETYGWNYHGYRISRVGEVKKSNLPEGYQEVEYIESTGTQWIDTGIKFKYGYTVITSVNFPNNISIGTMYISGADENYYSNFSMDFAYHGTLKIVMYRAVYGTDVAYPNTNRVIQLSSYTSLGNRLNSGTYVLKSSPEQLNINDITFSYSGNDNFTNTNIYVFNTNRNGHPMTSEYAFKGRMNYYYIKNSSENLIINLVPCKSTTTVTNVDNVSCPSGTIGLYDTVEGKFYTNQGSGTFIAGPDV